MHSYFNIGELCVWSRLIQKTNLPTTNVYIHIEHSHAHSVLFVAVEPLTNKLRLIWAEADLGAPCITFSLSRHTKETHQPTAILPGHCVSRAQIPINNYSLAHANNRTSTYNISATANGTHRHNRTMSAHHLLMKCTPRCCATTLDDAHIQIKSLTSK
jgi:hypothetical protein